MTQKNYRRSAEGKSFQNTATIFSSDPWCVIKLTNQTTTSELINPGKTGPMLLLTKGQNIVITVATAILVKHAALVTRRQNITAKKGTMRVVADSLNAH